MSDYDQPVVSVWRDTGPDWVLTQVVGGYSSLEFTPTLLDGGAFSVEMPYDGQQGAAFRPNRLVTVDWRGSRSTWCLSSFGTPFDADSGGIKMVAAGVGAFSYFGRCLAWPDPTQGPNAQPFYSANADPPLSGPAETVLRRMIAGNLRDRYGLVLQVPLSQNRGETVSARPNFQNLQEFVIAKARGVLVDVGLVNTTSTRARLSVLFDGPRDLRRSVVLSSKLGTLASWEQSETAPTGTVALVPYGGAKESRTTLAADVGSGAGTITVASSQGFPDPGDPKVSTYRIVIDREVMSVTNITGKVWTVNRGVGGTTAAAHTVGDNITVVRNYQWPVTTPESVAAATEWGGHREVLITGGDTRKVDELIELGQEALGGTASTQTVTLAAAEAPGLLAFRDYKVGDTCTAELLDGVDPIQAPVTAISVKVSSTGIEVSPTFGNPSARRAELLQAQMIRELRRRIQAQERQQ